MKIEQIKNQYSLIDKIGLAYRLLVTKFFFPTARLIRKGFEVRGKRMIDFGTNLTTGNYCRIEAFLTGDDRKKKIVFGDGVQLNDNVHISALSSVKLGNNVLIASHCYISDNSHGFYGGTEDDSEPTTIPTKRSYYVKRVNIGNNVWIAEGVIIMPGVKIGNGVIIGAHSIVKTNIPENCIAVGSPARVIKKWDSSIKRWIKVK